MKVNVCGKDFVLSFHHNMEERYTECAVLDTNGNVLGEGFAYCNPKDQFDRKAGRKFALSRALYPFTKEQRTEFWREYFSICNW